MSSYTEEFEQHAEAFYRETGQMAPGKDMSAAMGGADPEMLRYDLWLTWNKLRHERAKLAACEAENAQRLSDNEVLVAQVEYKERDSQKLLAGNIKLQQALEELRDENTRLASIVAGAGKIDMYKKAERRTLALRFDIAETAMEYARDPTEVFALAMEECMGKFRQWKREREQRENPMAAAVEAFAMAKHDWQERMGREVDKPA